MDGDPFTEPELQVREEAVGDRTAVFAVAGELHLSTAPVLAARLSAAIARGRTAIVVDLTEVGFVDSTGLTVLLNALRSLTPTGGRMAVVCTNPTVMRLFEITGLDTTFVIEDSVAPALARVQAAGGSAAGAP